MFSRERKFTRRGGGSARRSRLAASGTRARLPVHSALRSRRAGRAQRVEGSLVVSAVSLSNARFAFTRHSLGEGGPPTPDPARRPVRRSPTGEGGSLGEGGLRASEGSYAHKGMHMAWMRKARIRRKRPQKPAKNPRKTAKKCKSATGFPPRRNGYSEKTARTLAPGPMDNPKSPKKPSENSRQKVIHNRRST